MGWKGEALLDLRRGRNPPNGVFFVNFLLRLRCQKKVAKEFCLFQGGSSRTSTPTIELRLRCQKKVAKEFSSVSGRANTVRPYDQCACGVKRKWLRNFVCFRAGEHSSPLRSMRQWCQKKKWLRSFACLETGEHSSPLRSMRLWSQKKSG